jgi:hypothetical protein
MAKRRPSKFRTTLAATSLMVLFAVVIPWSCQLDTSPVIHRHPPVKRPAEPMRHGKAAPNDNDSGETK